MSKDEGGAPKEPTYDDYVERIHYSDKYNDDEWEYRYVFISHPPSGTPISAEVPR